MIHAFATCRDLPPLDAIRAHHDRGNPALGSFIQAAMDAVVQRGPMTATRYGVMRHLERTRHHVEVPDDAGVHAWAADANALLVGADGAVRAPDGKVLVDAVTGEPEPGASVPSPADSLERKAASEHALDARGIHVPAHLPPCISALEVELRDPREVAARCLALFIVAARAESVAEGDPLPIAVMQKRMPAGFAALTPKESAFVLDEAPERQDVINHLWRYEALAPLAWSVSLLDVLPFPADIIDVPALAKVVLGVDADDFLASARLRPAEEILAQLDATFRLHWAVVDARIKHAEIDGVESGAVVERHHALNWLTRFEDAAWDDVTTPT